MTLSVDFRVFAEQDGYTVAALPATLDYKIVFRDVGNVPSRAKIVRVTFTETGSFHVVLFNLPSVYDAAVATLEVYRDVGGAEFRLVGEVLPEGAGIFLDTFSDDPGAVLACDDPSVQRYESHIRWSEPFFPNWIRADSVAAFRLGDGDQITGMASLYGNGIIGKETSLHRIAVQAQNPPISRTDEISPDVGIIAPASCLTTDNFLYFLSWKGFMRYDNNVLQRMDGRFHEELMFRLKYGDQTDIRFASCAHNTEFDEIYLNFPSYGTATYHGYARHIRGQVYVIAESRGYATKFSYMGHPEVARTPKSHARLYHQNSLGELRSGEVFPAGTSPAMLFQEAPGETDFDTAYDGSDVVQQVAITNFFRSKAFTGNDETVIKRVRKVLVNWFSTGDRTMRISSIPRGNEDDRIDHIGLDTEYTFQSAPAIQRNTLHLTPQTPQYGNDWDDQYGKPIRFHVELEASGRTQLNSLEFWWRPMHGYLA